MTRSRWVHIRLLLRMAMVAVALAALAIVVSPTLAQGPTGGDMEPEGGAGYDSAPPTSILSPQAWESRSYDVGCHAAAGGSLTNHAWHEAWGTCYRLQSCGWIKRYVYNKYWAWEEDFKRAALGGKEYQYLDTVDLQFYVGHGNIDHFSFWSSGHDDCCLVPGDCYRSWGTSDNEWVALTSCKVLGGGMTWLRNWANCMNGTHMILGFETNAGARYPYYNTQGYWFADYLCRGYTVQGAWYAACDRAQGSGHKVRIIVNELAYLNERPAYGWVYTPDSTDTDAWTQYHWCGSGTARYVDAEALQYTMPRFQFAPFSLADAEAKYDGLGGVFGVPTTAQVAIQGVGDVPNTMWSDESGGRELEMDSGSGLYAYTDLNNLWTYSETQQAYLQAATITASDARTIADQFLTDNDLMPGDAQYQATVSDTISGGEISMGSLAGAVDSLLANEEPTVWQVIYSRVLTYTPPSIAGAEQEDVEFSVVGPGAKLKVLVPTSSAQVSALASENGVPVVRTLGGWRDIEGQGPTGWVQSSESVDILTPDQIYTLHDQLRLIVVLDPITIEFDDTEVLSHTVAYWETGAGGSQSEPTPVYELTVRFTLGGEEVAVDKEVIPANETYMRPFAEIASAPTEMVPVGETVHFTATEAATVLADMGYDASLDFVLGSGTADDYIYEWYRGTTEEANQIGTGRSIEYIVTGDVTRREGVEQQQIILRVTDITNPDQPSTTATVVLEVYPRVFLPTLLKANP